MTALPTPSPSNTVNLNTAVPADVMCIGLTGAASLILLIPGSGGTATGLLRLAKELQRRVGTEVEIAIVNLAHVVAQLDEPDLAGSLRQHLARITRALGPQRLRAVVGYSFGGLAALQLNTDLAHELQTRLPLCLIDTYAVERLARANHNWLRRLETKLAQLLYPPPQIPRSMKDEFGGDAQMPSPMRSRWDNLHEQYRKARWQPPTGPILLIQAERARHEAGLLWRRNTNGMAPHQLPHLRVQHIACGHLNLVRRAAPAVADLVAAHLHLASAPAASPAGCGDSRIVSD